MLPLSLLLSFGLLQPNGTVINFDADTLGRVPPGWSVAMTSRGMPLGWEVRRDLSAPTQPYVLAHLSNASGTDRSPLAIFNSLSLRDSDVSVRIKAVAGREEEIGGVVWRYRDPGNYYLALANALRHNVAIFRVQDGRRVQLRGPIPHDIEPNAWNILKVAVRGARFQVYVNHHRVLDVYDHTFTEAGKVGLWTTDDSVTYFDDFRVYPK
ncbi:MAG: hypothetical protein ACLQVN_09865 [Bryobacteraceae bacterium]